MTICIKSESGPDVCDGVYTHTLIVYVVCLLCAELGAGAEREGGHGRAAGRAGGKKRVSGESSPPQRRAQPHPETPRRPAHRRGCSVYGEQASAAVEKETLIY